MEKEQKLYVDIIQGFFVGGGGGGGFFVCFLRWSFEHV